MSQEQQVISFEDVQVIFEASLPGYTRRTHQMGLAAKIEEIIALALEGETKHGLLQAGTGTGKSFAILVPLAIAAHRHGQKSVVATSTKMLQTQYAKGDLPFLAEHLPFDIKYAVLKGRSNYPCWMKAEDLSSPTPVQRMIKDRMEAAKGDGLLDREDFPEVVEDDFKPFSMSAAECPGAKSCPFAQSCFAERAKSRAAEADIIVTNTAMLMLDLQLRQRTDGNVALLGDFDLLAIDEAHELPDAATRALEDTLGAGTFAKLARDMGAYLNKEGGNEAVAEKIELAAATLWDQLQMRYSDFVLRSPGKKDPMPLTVPTIIGDLGDGFRGLYQAIEATREEIKATPSFDEKGKIQRSRLLTRSANQLGRILSYTLDDPDTTLRWAEQETTIFRGEKRDRLYLRSAPVSVAPFLRSAMWDVAPAILSSATLATGTKRGGTTVQDFSYLAETLGLEQGEIVTYDAGSPFDFTRQARLFVPGKGFPEPDKANMPAWRTAAQITTHELVRRSGGGALLLFTSTTALHEAHTALAPQLRREGLLVLRQGEAPNGELIRQFKAHGNAVLFGLKSFMVGVDVPGRALRLVVMDKLPFAVPSDLLYQARCEAVNRRYHDRWASFTRLTIPMMILTLTQAFGRLIRHAEDVGMVAILDPRLHTKRYGPSIMNALPPATRTDDIKSAGAFLESIR